MDILQRITKECSMKKKQFLTIEQFEKVLDVTPEKTVHTFRDSGFALIGADWSKNKLVKTAKHYQDSVQVSGPAARESGHGVVFRDDLGYVFCKTNTKKLKATIKNL